MNTYRVDRVRTMRVPCGMVSIVHIGDSMEKARMAFLNAETGVDGWGTRDKEYGVVLSRWNGADYAIMDSRNVKAAK